MASNNAENYRPTQYNIQTGGSNGLLNDVVPSATSGVPLISQGSSSQPTFGTAVVAGGGTGITSATAYAVLCGGTSSTGALQSISGVGSSGQVLKSNGAGALPTFQAQDSAGNYKIQLTTVVINPADSTTYYLTNGGSFITSTTVLPYYVIPSAGTITSVWGTFTLTGVGSAVNNTLSIRLNNTTDTTISSTIQLTGTPVNFSNTGLSISVAAGDFITFKWVTPSFATNPTGVACALAVKIT